MPGLRLTETVRAVFDSCRNRWRVESQQGASECYASSPDSISHLLGQMAGERWPIRVTDISTDGLSLILSRAVASGTILSIDLFNANRGSAQRVHLRVVRCMPHPSGEWIAGTKFLIPLSDFELSAFW